MSVETECALCPCCSTPLVRASKGWACPKNLSHIKIRSDETVVTEIERYLSCYNDDKVVQRWLRLLKNR